METFPLDKIGKRQGHITRLDVDAIINAVNTLALTHSRQLRIITYPAISCGVYGYPIIEVCQVATDTYLAFLDQH